MTKKYELVEDTTYKDCVKIYFDFYEGLTGVKPLYTDKSGKCMKELIKWMKGNLKGGYTVQNFMRTLFENYELWEPFYKKQLNLNQILSNVNNICNDIKNGKRIDNTSKSKQFRARAQKIRERTAGVNVETGIQEFNSNK